MLKTLEQAKRLYTRVKGFCNRILSQIFGNTVVQYLSFKFFSLSKRGRIFVVIFIMFCSWFIYSKCIFRFENFNDGKKTEEYLRKRFPKGYKVKALVKLIERAGGECRKTRASKMIRILQLRIIDIGFVTMSMVAIFSIRMSSEF